MEYYELVKRIYPGIELDFNPACFDFSETVARERKLWRMDQAMPTVEQLNAAAADLEAELAPIRISEARKSDYEKEGLYLDLFVELLIEDDQEAIAAFRAARLLIKKKHPKA